jgi:hypothetical protein
VASKPAVGAHLVEAAQISGIVDGQHLGFCAATGRHHVRDAGQGLAAVQGIDLGQRQKGDVIGQRADTIILQLAGIGDDQDMIEGASDAVIDPISGDIGVSGAGQIFRRADGARPPLQVKQGMATPSPGRMALSIRFSPRKSLVWVVYQAWMGLVTVASLSRSALLSQSPESPHHALVHSSTGPAARR